MREILSYLMLKAGEDAYGLASRSGVPQPTTQRFLSGKHGDPRSTTVKKWAKAYGVSESQLRGDVPIDGIAVPSRASEEPPEKDKKRIFSEEQEFALSLVARMDKETKAAFVALFEKLVPERRKENVDPHPLRRLGSDIPPDPHDTRLHNHDQIGEIEQSKEINRK